MSLTDVFFVLLNVKFIVAKERMLFTNTFLNVWNFENLDPDRPLAINTLTLIISKVEETCGKMIQSVRLLQTLSSFSGRTSIQHTSIPHSAPRTHTSNS